MSNEPTLYVGLMSGTSVDGIDCALVEFSSTATPTLLQVHSHAIPAALKDDIEAISHPGDDEIERLGPLDRQMGQLFAEATLELLQQSRITPAEVAAIGSHGQTIRHRPASAGIPQEHSFTLQIGDPNTIAELTGITTVADFRRRDIAAGGEGAPLAPAFHASAFADSAHNRAIVNIGGIGNVTLLEGKRLLCGYDTGPGNTLMDHWYRQHHAGAYDEGGAWAASGELVPALLSQLLQHPYLDKRGPRSTGKETFNLGWLQEILQNTDPLQPADVQATLLAFTVETVASAIREAPIKVEEIYLCGGGAHNGVLRQRLADRLQPAPVHTTRQLGTDPDWVEAVAFAWLAHQTINRLPGNAPAVTGAASERVLGAIYPA